MKPQIASSNLALLAARDAESEIPKVDFMQDWGSLSCIYRSGGVWQGETDILPEHDFGFPTGLGLGMNFSGAKPRLFLLDHSISPILIHVLPG